MRTNAREILAPYIWVPKLLGGLVARALFTAVRRARATASARALDRARFTTYKNVVSRRNPH